VSASGFEADETVQIALHSPSAPAVPIGTLTANGSGAVSGIAYIPSSQPVGSYRLWAGAKSIGYLLLNAPLEISAEPETDRLSGPDRFQTAVAISQSFEPGVERVYIASGLNFPDALSAGALAAQKGAPVLLTHPDILLDPVRAELNRLEPEEIVLVGGTPSVSNAVESALEGLSFDPQVIRIAGADRFETNRDLVEEAFGSTPATTVFIATGLKFPDALAAAPAAAEGGGAVILVNGGAASLDAATLQLLDSLDVVDVRIVGDPASVSSGIENQLKTLYPGHVQRFAGADRYATAAKIVAATWPVGAEEVILASGVNFPDALAASALGQPMLTSLPSCIPGVILAELGNLAPSKVTLVGDAGALSTAVQNNFAHC
jgi:putative cell wall-binding protein